MENNNHQYGFSTITIVSYFVKTWVKEFHNKSSPVDCAMA